MHQCTVYLSALFCALCIDVVFTILQCLHYSASYSSIAVHHAHSIAVHSMAAVHNDAGVAGLVEGPPLAEQYYQAVDKLLQRFLSS